MTPQLWLDHLTVKKTPWDKFTEDEGSICGVFNPL